MTPTEAIIQFTLWLYLVLMLLLAVTGAHWMVMIVMAKVLPRRIPDNPPALPGPPRVLIQIPVFNEDNVVERIIDSAAQVDYPREKLSIQVLDDSTNEHAVKLAADRCAHWQEAGVQVEHVRRPDRAGYKAGALQYGLGLDDSPYVAIFDADFIIPKDFLTRSLGHFAQDNVGIVQWRWDHLNENDSWLTRAQGAMLDGHFLVEEVARSRAGWWCIFHGTAGIWRRACIDDAGGWSADTLAEDKDLSLRAYFNGWQIAYMDNAGCPAELPPTPAAFFSQQYRWTKGNIEVAVKLGPKVLKTSLSLAQKMEIVWRLYAPLAYLAVAPLLLLSTVLLLIKHIGVYHPPLWWMISVIVCWVFSLGFAFVAIVGAMARGRSWAHGLRVLPALLLIGPALAISNTAAVLQALRGNRSAFVCTPKFGDKAEASQADAGLDAQSVQPISTAPLAPQAKTKRANRIGWRLPETIMAAWLLMGAFIAVLTPTVSLFMPILGLASCGCFWAARGRRLSLLTG